MHGIIPTFHETVPSTVWCVPKSRGIPTILTCWASHMLVLVERGGVMGGEVRPVVVVDKEGGRNGVRGNEIVIIVLNPRVPEPLWTWMIVWRRMNSTPPFQRWRWIVRCRTNGENRAKILCIECCGRQVHLFLPSNWIIHLGQWV